MDRSLPLPRRGVTINFEMATGLTIPQALLLRADEVVQ